MGKKRIVEKSEEELIKEAERLGKKEIKLKIRHKVKEGRIYISSSYNNTIITLTDMKGNVLYWTSAGKVGFSGTKEGTPYAAAKAAEEAAEAAKQIGFEKVEVLIKGVGAGRESALRTLGAKGLNIVSIKDITPIPFDGPRPPKVRRV
jgi:small subunit ribosomal protein S11